MNNKSDTIIATLINSLNKDKVLYLNSIFFKVVVEIHLLLANVNYI